MMAEDSFDVNSFIRTTFEVTGSASFSNAWRFTLTVSYFRIVENQIPVTHADLTVAVEFFFKNVNGDCII